MREIIVAQNIIKDYVTKKLLQPSKTQRVLNEVSFSIKAGSRVAFIGPNGSGKSTTIKILSGITLQTSGKVWVNNLDPLADRKALSKSIGVVFGHCPELYGHLSVEQNFLYTKIIYAISDAHYLARVKKLDEYFDIMPLFSQNTAKLSLGQRMKCEIAATLLHDPKIIFLDEPTIGLDMHAKKKFRSSIKKIVTDYEKTLILTSHDIADIEGICDQAIIINKGSIIYDDKLATLQQMRQDFKTLRIVTTTFPAHWQLQGCSILEKTADKVIILVDLRQISLNEVLKSLVENSSFDDISIENEPLESIISNLYHG